MGLRDLSQNPFNPQVVAIGPLHREDENLQAYEKQKADFVQELLQLSNQTLQNCVKKTLSSMDRIRAFYDKTKIEKYNDDELAKIVVMDACFILQFIRFILQLSSTELQIFLCPSSIKIKKSNWRSSPIIHDLVLLENQIPYFVLEDIFDLTISQFQPLTSLPDFLLVLVQIFNVFETDITAGDFYPIVPHDHLLGFLEKCYWPPKKYSPSLELSPSLQTHTTVELHKTGIIFKPNRGIKWQMAMELKSSRWYWGKPALRMPALHIDKFTALVLRNLIAYEQASGFGLYVTSYAMAMDMLVDTEDDISKLIESKVVINHLRSDEWAAYMIKSLCKEIPVQKFCYVDLWQQLDSHYNSYKPKNNIATYFSSPWIILALVAGIAIVALTMLQNIFTVKCQCQIVPKLL